MSISAVELLRKSFGSLKTPVGQKIVGVFFLVQLLNFGSTTLTGTSTNLSAAALILSLVATVLGVMGTIGGLRCFRDGEFDLDNFGTNLAWPFGRLLGSNLIAGVLAYAVAFIFVGPAVLAAITSGITSVSGLTAAGAGIIALGAIGAILGLAAFIYISLALMLAQPFIAVDDMRMFEALDASIQRTRGSRLSIFTALLGLIAAYMTLLAVAALISLAAPEIVAQALSTVVLGAVMTPVGLKFLEQLSKDLSED